MPAKKHDRQPRLRRVSGKRFLRFLSGLTELCKQRIKRCGGVVLADQPDEMSFDSIWGISLFVQCASSTFERTLLFPTERDRNLACGAIEGHLARRRSWGDDFLSQVTPFSLEADAA